jgi:predicted nucleic acid-binding protein
VPIIGLIGVLLLAKNRALILSIKEMIADLQAKAGFYIADAVLRKALEAAGE